ncbi:MAG TPA: C25 family cysteine peptidase, partial [Candidatus Cloacimonadota bacterium]|nr:C25 family cysteine peptidase [Candidatus Cloacimonadota bacterium]
MKKLVLLATILILFSISLLALNVIPVGTVNDVQLVNSNSTGLKLHYTVGQLESFDVSTKGGMFSTLNIAGYSSTNELGKPALPLQRKLISVPLGATVDYKIAGGTSEEYSLQTAGVQYPIMPAQAPVSKSSDPEQIPFSYQAAEYQTDRYDGRSLIHIEEIGIMRGVRVFAVDFTPVQYNPAAKMVKVWNNVDVELTFHNGDLYETEQMRLRTFSPVFESVYAKTLLNYTEVNDRASNLRNPLGYLIISAPTLSSTMASFVTWKKQQGYNVTLVTTATTGTTTTAIKSYIQTIWNNATVQNPAPSFLLLVGDTSDIPAFTGQTASGHVTDLDYVKLNGTDYVPEMYYGRFSASTTTDLQSIIDKTLMYEKTTMPSTAYLGFVDMISGNDSTYGLDYADGQIRYGTDNYFNAAHGITSSTYLYAVSGSSSTATAIHSDVNTGRGYLNYTAHGSETGWYMPSFQTTDVDALTNANKYPVMVGNCCLSNHFDTAICFGEKLLRAANKGAVGYIGANNYSYWNEDYWWGVGAKYSSSQITAANGVPPAWSSGKIGTYDAVFHEHS